MKQQILIIIAVLAFLIGSTYVIYLFSGSGQKPNGSVTTSKLDKKATIYFYGDTCPHCIELDKWMKKNGVYEKLKIQKLEVFSNQSNAKLMEEAAQICKLDASQGLGVPFVFGKGKCYVGTDEAEKLFTEKMKKK